MFLEPVHRNFVTMNLVLELEPMSVLGGSLIDVLIVPRLLNLVQFFVSKTKKDLLSRVLV